MNKIAIGTYVTTHGIKGEIRIKSDFNEKDKVFKVGNEIIIDKPYIITGYRVHKGYDMVTLEGVNRIEDVINLKNSTVYIDRDKYFTNEVTEDDLIGYKVENKSIDTFLSEIRLNESLMSTYGALDEQESDETDHGAGYVGYIDTNTLRVGSTMEKEELLSFERAVNGRSIAI